MQTRWDEYQAPAAWTDEEKEALQRLRNLCELQYGQPGGFKGFAKKLQYPKGDSLYQILKTGQKVGAQVLKRLHEAGYDAASIFPEHEYVINQLRQSFEIQLPLLDLAAKYAVAESAPAYLSASLPSLTVYAQPGDVPPGCFVVRAPDDPKQRVLWVCDPNFCGDRGNRPLIIRTEHGLSVCPEYQICNECVYATVISETMEVHSQR